ncbi:MAG: polymer-forming cytoskeletal protein [Patescibacteria group bacterium]
MIFQKSSPKNIVEEELEIVEFSPQTTSDEVETVVGPSVNVEGDFASEGNIVVKGTVSGSVYTSKHLTVEIGAKIVANVRAGSATIAGEVKGNMKIKESLELTSTSKVLGDVDVRTLTVESGALLYGKITMPGMDASDKPSRNKSVKRVTEEQMTTLE